MAIVGNIAPPAQERRRPSVQCVSGQSATLASSREASEGAYHFCIGIGPPESSTDSLVAPSRLRLAWQATQCWSKLTGSKTIKFGATVTLVDEDTEEKKKYQIVGDVEADVKDGKISISSPISRALIGKAKGDTVEVAAPGGARSYEILDVKYG